LIEMSKEEVETPIEGEKIRYIRTVRPETRLKAINFIKDLFCTACQYDSECSSRYPEYLIKCQHIEEWALNKYKEHINMGTDENDKKVEKKKGGT